MRRKKNFSAGNRYTRCAACSGRTIFFFLRVKSKNENKSVLLAVAAAAAAAALRVVFFSNGYSVAGKGKPHAPPL